MSGVWFMLGWVGGAVTAMVAYALGRGARRDESQDRAAVHQLSERMRRDRAQRPR